MTYVKLGTILRRGREASPVRRHVDRGCRYRADQTALSRLRRAGHEASNERGRQLRRPHFRAVRLFSIMITSYRSIWLAIIFQLRMRVGRTVASALLCAKGNKLWHSANWARQRSALYMAISFA